MKKYIPSEIESKWQNKWAEDKLYSIDLDNPKDKYYLLVELPYSSGDLHIGHWFAFGVADIFARLKRMQGHEVFYPIGFDAFGLPAENAAIKRGLHPREWTMSNIESMSKQFKLMGATLNWENQVITCLPEYYKWNQWIFLKMLEKDVAYRGKVLSNWCPSCQTVLADEQVVQGHCDRCGTEVTKKEVDQWLLRITSYADKLEWQEEGNNLDWPKSVMEGQNNWIGKSEGVLLKFPHSEPEKPPLEVFTTRIDTIFGATFMVISPEHPVLNDYVTEAQKAEVEKYVEAAKRKSELERKENKEKTGVFTGSYVKNPFSGKDIPVWVADYVLMGYGTGAIMAVPAHDDRDFEFAHKFGLDIKVVVEPVLGQAKDNEQFRKSIVAIMKNPKDGKYLSINWGKSLGGNLFVGGGLEEGEDIVKTAEREIAEETGYTNLKLISKSETIHHHYTAFSKNVDREIEATAIYFELENDSQVEVKLEDDEQGKFKVEWLTQEEVESKIKEELHRYAFDRLIKGKIYTQEGLLTDSGDYTGLTTFDAREKLSKYIEDNQFGQVKINYHLHDWSISRQRYWGTPIPIIYCEKDGVVPVPESDLPVKLPDNVDHSPTGKSPLALAKDWYTVKCPKCGGEAKRDTDTMDGFVDNSWYFVRYLDPQNESNIASPERLKNWMPVDIYFGGAEHTLGHTLYSRFFIKFLNDIGAFPYSEYAKKRVHHGVILGPDGARMSKSKGNVVNPDEQVSQFGADAVRVYLAFLGPYEIVTSWNPGGINGVYHFLQRVWSLFDKVEAESKQSELSEPDLKMMSKTVKKVGEEVAQIKFNTAVAALMEWLNYLSKKPSITREEYKNFLILLAPFAPHITEELWDKLGMEYSIHQQSWPQFDNKNLQNQKITIIIQVDGKFREKLEVDSDTVRDRGVVEKLATESEKVKKSLDGKTVKNIVYIESKLINIVTL